MISSNYDILLFKTNVNNNLEKNIDNIFSNSVENILNKKWKVKKFIINDKTFQFLFIYLIYSIIY